MVGGAATLQAVTNQVRFRVYAQWQEVAHFAQTSIRRLHRADEQFRLKQGIWLLDAPTIPN